MNSAIDKTYQENNCDFVHQLFERQLNEVKDLTAICHGSRKITYNELNAKSERLSGIISSKSADSNIIAISTTRSIETIVGVLSILKSGRAYLPLDPSYPQERLLQVVRDAKVSFCIALGNESQIFSSLGMEVLDLEAGMDDGIYGISKADPLFAYVLYTSGSTGKPKGVCMGHRPLVNLIQWQQKHSVAGRGSRTLQFAPLSFDVSFQEIFATLTTGGTLYLVDDDLRLDPQRLLNFIQEEGINRIFLPFVALQFLTESADSNNNFPHSLKEVMTAGEQLKITPQVVRFFDSLREAILYNQYGPTECHVVTELKLEGNPAKWPALPSIGRPIDNTEIIIVDHNLMTVRPGEIGELCIAGACLAEGYLNRPQLTSEKFVTGTMIDGRIQRMYRTGDHARVLEDGNIEFLGRMDDQVKIRGYRIELGEIEVLLNHQDHVSQAVVTAR